ncbi:MAG TPA: hypothetical protein DCM70_05450 [Rhodobacteraceae bacterium]|nr:hypothetical protein [Paracoccaceae bacterium]
MSPRLFIWAAFGFILLGSAALIYFFVTNPQKVEIDTVHLREANSDRGAYIFWRPVVAIVTLLKGRRKKRDLPVVKNLKLTLEFLSLQIYLTAENMESEVGNLMIFIQR